LILALEQRSIGGAAIDVFDTEPLPPDHPFRRIDRLLATPHIGYVSRALYRRFYGDGREYYEVAGRSRLARLNSPIISMMAAPQLTATRIGAPSIPWRVVPPLVSTAFIMVGAGVLGTLLPLRFSAMGYTPGVIGLFATAEALGFLVGCLYAYKVIAPVGLERAYATFAGMKAVAILGLHFADNVSGIILLRFVLGLNAAGLSIIVESWLNALVPNEQRGRVLTIYVLVYGLFFGAGQLFAQNLNVRGPEMLILSGMATILALVPMVAIDVRAPILPHGVKLEILKALRNSPVSVLACLLNGLILTAFTTVGPLFGERIGFDQSRIVILMACVSLGGLFLQWPIGSISDKIDRRVALIGLGLGILAVATALVLVDRHTPFVLLAILFAIFGGLGESLYAVGVAHANDRAATTDYVGLSSTLLFVWALGAAIGPTTGTVAIQLTGPGAFFIYVIALTLAFTLFTVWRLYRRHRDATTEEREGFLAYPQTSPEIYAWLPYHRETATTANRTAGSSASSEPQPPSIPPQSPVPPPTPAPPPG
jgi:MFS family permease